VPLLDGISNALYNSHLLATPWLRIAHCPLTEQDTPISPAQRWLQQGSKKRYIGHMRGKALTGHSTMPQEEHCDNMHRLKHFNIRLERTVSLVSKWLYMLTVY
jgi:hypothetical protein